MRDVKALDEVKKFYNNRAYDSAKRMEKILSESWMDSSMTWAELSEKLRAELEIFDGAVAMLNIA